MTAAEARRLLRLWRAMWPVKKIAAEMGPGCWPALARLASGGLP